MGAPPPVSFIIAAIVALVALLFASIGQTPPGTLDDSDGDLSKQDECQTTPPLLLPNDDAIPRYNIFGPFVEITYPFDAHSWELCPPGKAQHAVVPAGNLRIAVCDVAVEAPALPPAGIPVCINPEFVLQSTFQACSGVQVPPVGQGCLAVTCLIEGQTFIVPDGTYRAFDDDNDGIPTYHLNFTEYEGSHSEGGGNVCNFNSVGGQEKDAHFPDMDDDDPSYPYGGCPIRTTILPTDPRIGPDDFIAFPDNIPQTPAARVIITSPIGSQMSFFRGSAPATGDEQIFRLTDGAPLISDPHWFKESGDFTTVPKEGTWHIATGPLFVAAPGDPEPHYNGYVSLRIDDRWLQYATDHIDTANNPQLWNLHRQAHGTTFTPPTMPTYPLDHREDPRYTRVYATNNAIPGQPFPLPINPSTLTVEDRDNDGYQAYYYKTATLALNQETCTYQIQNGAEQRINAPDRDDSVPGGASCLGLITTPVWVPTGVIASQDGDSDGYAQLAYQERQYSWNSPCSLVATNTYRTTTVPFPDPDDSDPDVPPLPPPTGVCEMVQGIGANIPFDTSQRDDDKDGIPALVVQSRRLSISSSCLPATGETYQDTYGDPDDQDPNNPIPGGPLGCALQLRPCPLAVVPIYQPCEQADRDADDIPAIQTCQYNLTLEYNGNSHLDDAHQPGPSGGDNDDFDPCKPIPCHDSSGAAIPQNGTRQDDDLQSYDDIEDEGPTLRERLGLDKPLNLLLWFLLLLGIILTATRRRRAK